MCVCVCVCVVEGTLLTSWSRGKPEGKPPLGGLPYLETGPEGEQCWSGGIAVARLGNTGRAAVSDRWPSEPGVQVLRFRGRGLKKNYEHEFVICLKALEKEPLRKLLFSGSPHF